MGGDQRIVSNEELDILPIDTVRAIALQEASLDIL
jgi:hypothetical protein